MRVYGSSAIRNVAFVGHGAAARPPWLTRSPSCPAPAAATARSRTAPPSPITPPTKSNASTPSASASAFAEWMDTKLNLHRYARLPRFLRRGDDRAARRRRRGGGAERDRRRRGGHREGLGGLRPPAPAADHLRVPDGQGARQFRAGLRRREGAPLAQGGAGGDPGRRRRRLPRDHQPALRARPTSTRRAPRPASTTRSPLPDEYKEHSTRSTTSS